MPKRSNDFQRLVLRINQHLANSSAKVTESKMLWDDDAKQHREMDIYIEDKAGPYDVKIGVECTEKRSGINLVNIEQLHSKHKSLCISRTVIVSKYGFSASAKNYARKANIELLTFGKAMEKSWPSYLQKLMNMTVVRREYRLCGAEYNVSLEAAQNGFTPTDTVRVVVGGMEKSLAQFVFELQSSSSKFQILGAATEETEDQSLGTIIRKVWKFSPPIILKDDAGIQSICDWLETHAEIIDQDKKSIRMTYDDYAGSEIVYGGVKDFGPIKEANITVSPTLTVGQSPRYSLSLDLIEKGLPDQS